MNEWVGGDALQPVAQEEPYLVPLMSRRERLIFFGLFAIWLAVLAEFWWWWLDPEHNVGWFRFLVNSMLAAWTTILPLYFLILVARSRVQNPSLELPHNWRVAMVVTKAPSEPESLVKRTILAMLSQSYPHDTWLADEDPSPEMLDWCSQRGVKVSCRRDFPDYHQPEWPRRTKCKEGNLAYFYDCFGYESYDFVAQLDADHVPMEGYLEAVLRPFLNPEVGYVSAPSICDRNASKSWAARGRLQCEALFHGAMQTGYTAGLAPLCIGSHYAVRTAALKEIGGLGPELAEDHSTTLLMNSAGWRGVHAIDAEAHGDGPNTFPDMLVQEFQWSRSLITILLRYTPKYARSLSSGLLFQFLFCQLWYVFFSVSLFATIALPIIALLSGQAWVGISYVEFFIRITVLSAVLLIITCWLREQGWLRPSTKLISWEGALFIFSRWPWTMVGITLALSESLRGKTSDFKVTPKGDGEVPRLPFRLLVPYLGISAVSGLVAIFVDDPGSAGGFYVFTVLNCFIYLAVVLLIIAQHPAGPKLQESLLHMPSSRAVLKAMALGSTAFIFVISATLRSADGFDGILWGSGLSLSSRPSLSKMVRGTQSVQLGIYDWHDAFGDEEYVAIDHDFISWIDVNPDRLKAFAAKSRLRDRWPLVTVEPWSDGREGSAGLLQAINGGRYDPEIARSCSALADMEMPVFVRWGHEMEVATGRYPWADVDADAFVEAYRRYVDICRETGGEFYFVWSPRGDGSRLDEYFPGSDYVDQVGLSLYSYRPYELEAHGRVRSFAENLSEKYERVRKYGKTIMIAELGADGTSDQQYHWLFEGLSNLDDFPLIGSIVYFNAPDSPGAWGDELPVPDWNIDPSTFKATAD